MHKPSNRFLTEEDLTNNFFNNIGKYIKSIQLKSGAIPSDDKNLNPESSISDTNPD